MQAISLRPQQRLIISKRIAVYLLVALMAVFPALSLPLTMLMPLFTCPLMKAKKRWVVLIVLPLPAVIALLYGYSPVYAIGLLLMTVMTALPAYQSKSDGLAARKNFMAYIVPMLTGICFALWGLYYEQWQAGTNLAEYVANQVEQWLMTHPKRTHLLYQMISAGALPVPEGYKQVTLLNLTLDPGFLREVRLMLHSRVMQLVETMVPSLMTQSGIIISLFIHLRMQRMWGAYLLLDQQEPQKVSVALAPSYSNFRIPRKEHGMLFLCLMFYFLFAGSTGLLQRLAQILYHSFETLYQLQGGAVVCGYITRKNADRRVLSGILAATLYLIAPFALFVIGCFENVFSFRPQAEDDKNEREKNEEEEP